MKQRLAGGRLAGLLERLGPIFVKVGQLLSTREDLFPPELLEPLKRLQDHVEPTRDWPGISSSIERSTGRPLIEVFSEFDQQPVSTASISHVYRARLRDTGEVVAVKVRRPSIERTVGADLRLIRLVGRALEHSPPLRDLPIVDALDTVSAALAGQLDFRKEAGNARRFTALFSDTPRVRLARLVDRYCTEDVIVMEFIPGMRRLDDPTIPAATFEQATRLALHVVYRMIFTAGRVHCDLHPANMCLSAADELVVLDTGFVTTLGEGDRRRFRAFFVGMVFDDSETCSRILLDTAARSRPGFDSVAFRRDVRVLIAETSGLKAGEFQVARFAGRLFDLQRRHGLRGSTDFTMAILALLVVEGVVRHRLPDLDFQRAAIPYVSAGIFGR